MISNADVGLAKNIGISKKYSREADMLALKRLIAYWIDFMLLAVILVGVQLLIYFLTGGWPFNNFHSGPAIELWVICTMSAPVWIYFIVSEYRWGQTLEKRLFKLRVTADKGKKITFEQAWMRTLGVDAYHVLLPTPWWDIPNETNNLIYIPNALIILYVFYLFSTKGQRGIHDIISRTQVISG